MTKSHLNAMASHWADAVHDEKRPYTSRLGEVVPLSSSFLFLSVSLMPVCEGKKVGCFFLTLSDDRKKEALLEKSARENREKKQKQERALDTTTAVVLFFRVFW